MWLYTSLYTRITCAHEIAEYKLKGQPIPFSCVHDYWKKLDMLVFSKARTSNISCTNEVDMFVKQFNEVDDARKLYLLRKSKEILNHYTTSLYEPEVKSNMCDWPSVKVDTSTRSNPSAFEYVLSTQDDQSCSKSTKNEPKKLWPKSSNNMPKKFHQFKVIPEIYMHSIPYGLQPYVCALTNVDADCNCGFRTIVDLMNISDENWAQVRRDLIDKLQSHTNEYNILYGDDTRVKELLDTNSFESNPSHDRWMTMSNTGHLIASRYNVVLIHISRQQCLILHIARQHCLIFLPLRSKPLHLKACQIISIGFVNGNNFVKVILHLKKKRIISIIIYLFITLKLILHFYYIVVHVSKLSYASNSYQLI